MNTDQFWNLIDAARKAAGSTEGVPRWLISFLKEQSVEEIVAFAERYHELDDKAFDCRLWAALALLTGRQSDDSFDYFRCWLIAQGREIYELVLKDPEALARIETTNGDRKGPFLEDMGAVASLAYGEKVGDEYADLPADIKPPSLKNGSFWNGNNAELRSVFPKLYEIYERRLAGLSTR